MISKILQSRFLGGFALFGAAIIYATLGIFIRAMAKMFGDSTQVAVRLGLVAIILLVVLMCGRRSLRLTRRQIWPVLGLSVGCSALLILFTFAVTTTTIASSVFSLYAGSIITSLIVGTMVFKEQLTVVKIAAIGIALAGLAVYSGGFVTLSAGIAAAFLAGILDGLTNALRKVLRGVSRLKVQFYQNGIGAVFAAIVVLATGEHAFRGHVSWWPVLATFIFAGLIIGLGYLLLFGFQHFDVNAGTVILATELFFATLVGIVFYSERPDANQVLGGCLIFSASVLTIGGPAALLRHKNWRKKSSPQRIKDERQTIPD